MEKETKKRPAAKSGKGSKSSKTDHVLHLLGGAVPRPPEAPETPATPPAAEPAAQTPAAPAAAPAAGPQLNDPVRRRDHLLIVLHCNHRSAAFHHTVQQREKVLNVKRMQAYGRLIH